MIKPGAEVPQQDNRWTGIVMTIVVSPVLAWKLFVSRSPYPDIPSGLNVLGRARNIVAFVVVLGAAIYWDPTSLSSYAQSSSNAISNVGLMSLAIVLIACAATWPFVRRGQRFAAARALARPIVRIVILIGLIVVLHSLGFIYLSWDGSVPDSFTAGGIEPGTATVNGMAFLVLRNIFVIWITAFLVTAIIIVSGNMFTVGDAHPRLATIASVTLTGTVLLVDVIGAFGVSVPLLLDDGGAQLPEAASTLFTAFGVATTVALSLVEWRWWGRMEFLIRQGPWL